MQLLRRNTDFVFLSASFLLTVFYLLLFIPVSDAGDGPAYLRYAQTLIENGDTGAFIQRAPLYPWFLSLFISAFGTVVAIKIVFVVQYFLLFISIALLYDILIVLFSKKSLAMCAALIAMVNLSGIFYGFMLLTETMTMFLLIMTIWFLYNGINKSSLICIFLSGILGSAMVLTRFNTLPLLLIFIGIIFLFEFIMKGSNLRISIYNLVIFIVPVLFIINGYAFMNYQKHNFYGLFPTGGSVLVSRNALIATLDGKEEVSGEYLAVLDIFMTAENQYKEKKLVERKGSLIRFDRLRFTEKLYKGFPVYTAALPELCRFFNINPDKPEPEISGKLAPFYHEIYKLNNNKIWGMRGLSLLSSFRSSTGLVIFGLPDINLGKLPAWIIMGYKLIVIAVSVMVFLISIMYLILCVFKAVKVNWTVILFILIIFGFFLINFVFAAESNSNRFKYPAEPFIISLSVYYFYIAFMYLKRKKIDF